MLNLALVNYLYNDCLLYRRQTMGNEYLEFRYDAENFYKGIRRACRKFGTKINVRPPFCPRCEKQTSVLVVGNGVMCKCESCHRSSNYVEHYDTEYENKLMAFDEFLTNPKYPAEWHLDWLGSLRREQFEQRLLHGVLSEIMASKRGFVRNSRRKELKKCLTSMLITDLIRLTQYPTLEELGIDPLLASPLTIQLYGSVRQDFLRNSSIAKIFPSMLTETV